MDAESGLMMQQTIKIGTRASQLAMWQTNHVASLLRSAVPDCVIEIVTFTTRGDKILDKPLPEIGGKGLFTEELERSLLSGEIDCAVHSLKDLPTENPPGLTIGAIPQRAPHGDVLVSKNSRTLEELPEGANVGTSSLRRAAQLRSFRPDLSIIDIRGNVPTRIEKALDPNTAYDAIVLAQAGVDRLELTDHIAEIIPEKIMLPAPGQGAIAVQCRDEEASVQLFSLINHPVTRLAVTAERAFLNRLEGGCSVPVAAYALYEDMNLQLQGRVVSVDGQRSIEHSSSISIPDFGAATTIGHAAELGSNLALDTLSDGADKILAEVRNDHAK